ncbi:MAG: SMP-30/gluconolactonase/LRE family protein [Saprospiraceae bacterium]|nr:SMP-30/gluconolactonase/LRE family protein [Saprospiraceae bacterium]
MQIKLSGFYCNKISFIFIAFCFVSCSKTIFYKSFDFTQSLFTEGIEGPMFHSDGNIYVVNFKKEGTIGLVRPNGNCELFINLPIGSIGNAIRFNSKGDMMVADYTGHSILKVDMKSKVVSVYAHNNKMNQPNDLAIMKNDVIFCSDPDWNNSNGKLWRIDTDGSTVLLLDSLGTTNGIEVSKDDKFLYVNESVQQKVWRYDITEKSKLINKKLLIKFDTGGLDGMKCDNQGNLWITRYGEGLVIKLSPEGDILQKVELKGKKPSNLTLGGKDNKTIFVTMQDRRLIEKFNIPD